MTAVFADAICRVSLTVTVHRAAFGSRSTWQPGPQLSRRPDSLQKAAKVNANAEEDIRKMSATTRLCRHAEAGPGARAAQPHTHAAIPVPLLHLGLSPGGLYFIAGHQPNPTGNRTPLLSLLEAGPS